MRLDKHKINKQILKTGTPVILEVGAHYGEDSVKFLESFPKAKLFCFEPDPRNIYIFKKYIKDDRINLFESAVSGIDADGVDFYQSYLADFDRDKMFKKYHWISREDYLNLDLNRSGASSLKKGIAVEDGNVIKVKTVKLDTWLKENNIDCVDLLWIDVQGGERNVIEGASDSLNKIRYMWIEYGETDYEGAMTRRETKKLLRPNFSLIRKYSKRGKKGDLLFRNKRL